MKRNSGPMLLRDLRREIARTAGRFISITVIVALGVAFFVGLRATGPDMRQSADGYFDRQQMMDLELLSTLGFTQEDVQALQAQTGVEQVQPGYQLDALVVQDTAETVVKLYSIPPQGEQMLSREGHRGNSWELLDYGSIVVHVFTEEARKFYDLERLWADAELVDIRDIIIEEN